MTEEEAQKRRCPFDVSKYCLGADCMAWEVVHQAISAADYEDAFIQWREAEVANLNWSERQRLGAHVEREFTDEMFRETETFKRMIDAGNGDCRRLRGIA